MDELRFGFSHALSDDGETLELDVYSVVGAYEAPDASQPRHVRNAIKAAKNATLIRVNINSPGGFLTDALAIYKQLVAHPAQVETIVDGLAASAATIIAMAGNRRFMAEHAEFMIHEPSTLVIGDAEYVQKQADRLDKEANQMAALYAQRTGGDEEEIRELMRAETWMTAEEALDVGFIDEIVPGKAGEVEERIAACLTPSVMRAACIDRVPDRIAAKANPQKSLPLPEGSANANPQPKRSDMKTIASALGLSVDATEAQLVEAVGKKNAALSQSAAHMNTLIAATGTDSVESALAVIEAQKRETEQLAAARDSILAATETDSVEKAIGVIEAGKAASEELAATQAKLEEQARVAEQKERDQLVADLAKAGKLTPAQINGWVKSATLEQLQGYAETAPVIAGKSENREPPTSTNTDGMPAPGTKSWDEMTSMERHALWKSDRDAYNALKPERLKNRDLRDNH